MRCLLELFAASCPKLQTLRLGLDQRFLMVSLLRRGLNGRLAPERKNGDPLNFTTFFREEQIWQHLAVCGGTRMLI